MISGTTMKPAMILMDAPNVAHRFQVKTLQQSVITIKNKRSLSHVTPSPSRTSIDGDGARVAG